MNKGILHRYREILRFAEGRGRVLFSLLVVFSVPSLGAGRLLAQQSSGAPMPAGSGELRHGRELLQSKQFRPAKQVFQAFLAAHPGDVQGELGLGDAELGLRDYEAAEMDYRSVVAQQPELWGAHKNLVVVEAALGRWEEFDRERTVLRLARERGAPNISVHESDVIDSFSAGNEHWVVRAYYEPMGRSEALYNFERFSPGGRVEEYVSLENAAAAKAALTPEDVRIGGEGSNAHAAVSTLALNWYSRHAHGTIATFHDPPSYERVRSEVQRWLKRPAGKTGPSSSKTGSQN